MTTETILARCLDVLTRLCPTTCEAHGLEQSTDAEVDAAIQAAATQLHGEDATKWPAPVLMASVVRAMDRQA